MEIGPRAEVHTTHVGTPGTPGTEFTISTSASDSITRPARGGIGVLRVVLRITTGLWHEYKGVDGQTPSMLSYECRNPTERIP